MTLKNQYDDDLEKKENGWIVTEEHLPLRVIGSSVDYSQKGTPGTIVRDSDKSVSFFWNPFSLSSDPKPDPKKPFKPWHGRISYGKIICYLLVDDVEHRIVIHFQPSPAHYQYIQQMWSELQDNISLLVDDSSITYSNIDEERVDEDNAQTLFKKIEQDMKQMIPILYSISKHPFEGFCPISGKKSISNHDNSIIKYIVEYYCQNIIQIMYCIISELEKIDFRIQDHQKEGYKSVSNYLEPLHQDKKTLESYREQCTIWLSQLRQKNQVFRFLTIATPPIIPSSKLRLDMRYNTLYQLYLHFKRKQNWNLLSNKFHILSNTRISNVYEKWSILELLAIIQKLGWKSEQNSFFVNRHTQNFYFDILRRTPIRFTNDSNIILEVIYEPVLQYPNIREKRSKVISTLFQEGRVSEGFYTTGPNVTPDIILRMYDNEGRKAYTIGDCMYCILNQASTIQQIGDKQNKITNLYIKKSFWVIDTKTYLLPVSKCSFLIFPGNTSYIRENLDMDRDTQPLSFEPGSQSNNDRKEQIGTLLASLQKSLEYPKNLDT